MSKQEAQARFQELLLKLAYQKASDAKEKLAYDIRGRVIYDLTLTDKDLGEIARQLTGEEQASTSAQELLAQIEKQIGFKISQTIRCNLDLNNPTLQQSFNSPFELSTILQDPQEYMSIIPIHEEMLNNIDHHANAVRTRLETECKNDPHLLVTLNELLNNALEAAKRELKHEIEKIYDIQKDKGPLSAKALNQILDKARVELQKKTKQVWFDTFQKELDTKCTDQQKLSIYQSLSGKDFKKLYSNIPAHSYDILGSDHLNHTTSYVTNSAQLTAHNKHEWATKGGAGTSAFRFMIRNHLGDDLTVTARSGGQLAARVPSVADVKSKKDKDLEQIIAIFVQFHKDFDRASEHQGPIVYNLLTSINSGLENLFDLKNKQNESAERIVTAVHRYNKKANNPDDFIWLQNLGVNRHSDNLDKLFASSLHQELRLMADIAMLYTLQSHFQNAELTSAYRNVVEVYQKFLNKSNKPEQFSSSPEGKQAIKLIAECKNKIILPEQRPDQLLDKANLALLKIYKNNMHYQEQYGSLVQALSIFVEKKSVAGCKSANERHEDVQKKVSALIAMDTERACNEHQQALDHAFDAFLMDHAATPELLRVKLDSLVNKTRMYGDEASISHSDQAAASKLQTIPSESAVKGFSLGTKLFEAGAGIAAVSATCLGIGLLFPPLAVVGVVGLLVAAGVAAVGLITAGISALFKGFNTNKGCALELENNVNERSSKTQSAHGAKLFMKQCEQATFALSNQANTLDGTEPSNADASEYGNKSSYGHMSPLLGVKHDRSAAREPVAAATAVSEAAHNQAVMPKQKQQKPVTIEAEVEHVRADNSSLRL